MTAIGKLTDLEKYGLFPLTGEACGLMMRVLCDFSEQGKQWLSTCFGFEFKGSEPWNSSTGGRKHVGSVMLDPDAYLTLGVFALLENGHDVVYRAFPRPGHSQRTWIASTYQLIGFGFGDEVSARLEWVDAVRKAGWSLRRYEYDGTAGSRNRHEMSGRVE